MYFVDNIVLSDRLRETRCGYDENGKHGTVQNQLTYDTSVQTKQSI